VAFARTARSIALSSLIAVALYLSGLLVMLTPLPILHASAARGRWAGIAVAFISLAAVAMLYFFLYPAGAAAPLSGIASYIPIPGEGLAGFVPLGSMRVMGVVYFAFFALIALALGEGARFRWGITRWGGVALLTGIFVVLAAAGMASLGGMGRFFQSADSYIKFVVNQVVEANAQSGAASTQLTLLAEHADEVVTFVVRMIPSLVFVFVLITVAVNLVIGRRLIRGHHQFSHVHNVARFKLPDLMVWAVIAAGIIFFADRYVVHAVWPAVVALNCIVSLAALYFFQGLAVTVYLLQGIRFPLFRTLAYVAMVIFLQAASVAMVVIGVADVWVDFRLRRWRAMHHQS